MSYAAQTAMALRLIRAKGATVSFARTMTDSYDPATDVDQPYTVTCTGSAVRVRGDARQYAALGLVQSDAATLLFAPDTAGEIPPLESTVIFGGAQYVVRATNPVAPDGDAIVSRLICAGGGVEHVGTEPVLSVTSTEALL
jgi:hypothetical protein